MQLNENQKQKIKDFFDANTIDIWGADALQLLENINENNDEALIEAIRDALIDDARANGDHFNYNSAMRYLAKKDPSLCRCFGLLERRGYDLKNIDSKRLASLHWIEAQVNLINNFDFKDLIEIIKNNQ